jgi:hypothetical protein
MLRAMSFRSGSSVAVLGLLSASFAGGCAYGEVRQVVRAQFATELDCPEVQIKRRDAWYGYDTGNQFKVSGCGVMRTYTCNDPDGRVSYDEPACTWVEGDADAPQMAKPMPDDPAMDEPLPEFEPGPAGYDEPASEDEPATDPFEESEQAPESEAESEEEPPAAPAKPAVKKGGSKVGKVGR